MQNEQCKRKSVMHKNKALCEDIAASNFHYDSEHKGQTFTCTQSQILVQSFTATLN